MNKAPTKKPALTPAEDDPWGKFLLKTIELDGTPSDKKPQGYYWFWGIYFLDKEVPELLELNFNAIKNKLPSTHWLTSMPEFKEKGEAENPLFGKSDEQTQLEETRDILLKTPEFSMLRDILTAETTRLEDRLINLSGLYFKENIDLSKFIFPAVVSFQYTRFCKGVNFSQAVFYNKTYFKETEFNGIYPGSTNFYKTKFFGFVDFIGAQLNSIGTFTGAQFFSGADFNKMVFHNGAYFDKAEFGFDADFRGAKFLNKSLAHFESAKFSKNALFNSVEFSCYIVDFTDARFLETANFKNTLFYGETAKFSDAVFQKIANFNGAIFKNYANFKSSKFRGRTSFRKAIFETHAPRFYGAEFNNEMTFFGMIPPKFEIKEIDETDAMGNKITDKEEIHGKYKERIQENQNSYENTAILLEEKKKYHDQHLFFRAEMRCRRRTEESLLIRCAYVLYENFVNYGYGIGHAFCWWLGHIVAGGFLLFITAYLGYCKTLFSHFTCAFGVSLSNAHGFVFMKNRLGECYKIFEPLPFFTGIWVMQTVIGILFLFLLLLTLRVRFRLK